MAKTPSALGQETITSPDTSATTVQAPVDTSIAPSTSKFFCKSISAVDDDVNVNICAESPQSLIWQGN
ncbi:hypothetical protein HPP92_003292 [Vanilla planifolia]|uniref:Uncharacterized protein n=1 Tax=Vanilla planifolia TaxID=51239 RepID=A0A835S1Z8_VANPL|nr:hypothetical protein HPP92_003292 [Vanilla planifolia]